MKIKKEIRLFVWKGGGGVYVCKVCKRDVERKKRKKDNKQNF